MCEDHDLLLYDYDIGHTFVWLRFMDNFLNKYGKTGSVPQTCHTAHDQEAYMKFGMVCGHTWTIALCLQIVGFIHWGCILLDARSYFDLIWSFTSQICGSKSNRPWISRRIQGRCCGGSRVSDQDSDFGP